MEAASMKAEMDNTQAYALNPVRGVNSLSIVDLGKGSKENCSQPQPERSAHPQPTPKWKEYTPVVACFLF
jgi:hypothetical protein